MLKWRGLRGLGELVDREEAVAVRVERVPELLDVPTWVLWTSPMVVRTPGNVEDTVLAPKLSDTRFLPLQLRVTES